MFVSFLFLALLVSFKIVFNSDLKPASYLTDTDQLTAGFLHVATP